MLDVADYSEPKDVTDEEYKEFYKAMAKEPLGETLGWSHFKVSAASGSADRRATPAPGCPTAQSCTSPRNSLETFGRRYPLASTTSA